MNGSTVFSKLDMTMGLHQTELERHPGKSQHFQLVKPVMEPVIHTDPEPTVSQVKVTEPVVLKTVK